MARANQPSLFWGSRNRLWTSLAARQESLFYHDPCDFSDFSDDFHEYFGFQDFGHSHAEFDILPSRAADEKDDQ